MYTAKAMSLRKCRGQKINGQPCQAWAMWDHPGQLCASHGGRHHRGPMPKVPSNKIRQAKYKPCTCQGYQWPHRPGGGCCRWPDPPVCRRTIPASTHAWPRLRSKGEMVRRWGISF